MLGTVLTGVVAGAALICGYAWRHPVTAFRHAMALQRRLLGFRQRATDAAGFRWAWIERGRGVPVVMIHGFGASKDNWVRFAARLPSGFRLVIPDLPGFGESGRDPEQLFDVATQARRVLLFLDAVGIQRFHLMGNSMGGHIAALIAARYPDRVQSLVLIASAGVESPRDSELIATLKKSNGESNLLVLESAEDFPRFARFVFVKPPYMPHLLRRGLVRYTLSQAGYHRALFRHLIDHYVPLEPELHRIRAPVLIVWGDRDRVLDASSIDVLQSRLRQVESVVLQDCGHIPMLERPAETARHVGNFLERHRASETRTIGRS